MSDTAKYATTTILAVVALVIGFFQFGNTYARSVQQPFLETQTKTCLLAAENAARLATTIEAETWQKAREEFWMLYFGPLAIVEDMEANAERGNVGDVRLAMQAFGGKLRTAGLAPSLPVESLQQNSLAIAHACRDLLVSRWGVGVQSFFAQ
jgi:hypothetical protein